MKKNLQQSKIKKTGNNTSKNTVKLLKGEIFLPVKGYEGLYKVSNLGRIKRLEYKQKNPNSETFCLHKEKLLKTKIDRHGYEIIGLCSNSIKKYFSVHRLVAKSFLPNKENLPCINHKDNNPKNNNLNNLEWISWVGNIKYKIDCGRQIRGVDVNTNKLSEKQVIKIRSIKNNLTYKQIAIKYNVNETTIGSIKRRETWKHI